MIRAESEYWDSVARQCIADGYTDNIWKKQEILRRLLKEKLIHKNVLEIGVGLANVFSAVKALLQCNFAYLGTDVSNIFVEHITGKQKLDCVHTDARVIPTEADIFDLVCCFDSLEHIRSAHRYESFAEISRVLRTPGRVIINMPVEESRHNPEFDHPFTQKDVMALMDICRMELTTYEQYAVRCNGNNIRYNWIVGER